jgi:hypothetical protein
LEFGIDVVVGQPKADLYVTGKAFNTSSGKYDYVTLRYDKGLGARIWQTGTWREGPALGSPSSGSFGAFSPDGQLLALSDVPGVVRGDAAPRPRVRHEPSAVRSR